MRRLLGSLLCSLLLGIPATPSSGEGIVRWVDADGRVHFGNRPTHGRAEEVDLSRTPETIRVNPPTPGDGLETPEQTRRRSEREAFLRFADEYAKGEAERRQRPGREAKERDRREARCQGEYGRSCAELERWKDDAIASCKRRNLSVDCEDPGYLATQRPKTRSEIADIKEKRRRSHERRLWRDRQGALGH